MLKIYNSLTKQVEEFIPIDNIARMYSCGPTVYDYVHLGNLSSFIFTDTINRSLELSGIEVKHVMNITDIDDKTIKRSIENYIDLSPEEALVKLTNKYEESFKEDLQSIGIRLDRIHFIRATDSIDKIQPLILELLKNKYAYIADDGIYFSINEYKISGKIYGQLLELDSSNTSQARINNDEYDKHSVHDFVLWKFMRPDEPAWSFVIDNKDYLGRPGWHIECSAMSTYMLGQPFDIHTGGIDLIFPHHENEIAQSTAGKSNPIYAKYFYHNEHLLINSKKMSKSLGNMYNLTDLVERKYSPLSYRLLILQSHYRNQANFSWDLLEAANNRLIDLQNLSLLSFQIKDGVNSSFDFEDIKQQLKNIFLNDLNTPKVLALISNFQNLIQKSLISKKQQNEFMEFIKYIDIILGLELSKVNDISDNQKNLLIQRQKFRDNKEWARSDEIRDKLKFEKIGVRDTEFGQIWYKINQ